MLLAERTALQGPEPRGLTAPQGDELLEILRGPKTSRQVVDAGVAGGLRAWLNDACFERRGQSAEPLVVTKKMVAGFTHQATNSLSYDFVRGALVATLFRLFVTSGPSATPFFDACEALFAEPHHAPTQAFVASLAERDRRGLEREITLHARNLARRWPALLPAWMPRTKVSLATTLDGGNVALRGVADLAIGVPHRTIASICLVSVRSTPLHPAHRDELRFLGLIETLRSGIPPFRLATYSTLTGEVLAEAVTEDLLRGAVDKTIAAIERGGVCP